MTDTKGKILDGPTIAMLLAERACKEGVAYSQASMGRWTREKYEARTKEIDEEFKAKLACA